jgi:hypothetical protein
MNPEPEKRQRPQDEESNAWWAELEEQEVFVAQTLDWCCKLVMDNDFENVIEEIVNSPLGVRVAVNYCPHCRNEIARNFSRMKRPNCCRMFRDIGLESLQVTDKSTNDTHNLFNNFCTNCGNDMKEFYEDSESGEWAGEHDCGDDCDGSCGCEDKTEKRKRIDELMEDLEERNHKKEDDEPEDPMDNHF